MNGYNVFLTPHLKNQGFIPPSISSSYPFQAHASGTFAIDSRQQLGQTSHEKEAYGLTGALLKVMVVTGVLSFAAYKMLT